MVFVQVSDAQKQLWQSRIHKIMLYAHKSYALS
jgi:hypothetical protein